MVVLEKIMKKEIKGKFYADKECQKLLFLGQLVQKNNITKIKVLDFYGKSFSQFGGQTLFAVIYDERRVRTGYSFTNCRTEGSLEECIQHDRYVYFSESISYNDFLNERKENITPKFILPNDKFKRMSVGVKNLDDWLWKSHTYDLKDIVIALDENDNPANYENIANYVVKNKKLSKKIKIDGFTIVLKSGLSFWAGKYPDIEFAQNASLEIISDKKIEVYYFYRIISLLRMYFTILWNKEFRIYDISVFEKFKYRINFFSNNIPIEEYTLPKDYFSISTGMYFQHVKNKLSCSIKRFFNVYYTFSYLINFLTDIDVNMYIDVYTSQQIQVIETYGNIKSNGVNKTNNAKDIEFVIQSIPDDIFNKLFVDNGIWSLVFGFEEYKQSDTKEILKTNLQSIRNYLIHPCLDGQNKNLLDAKCKIAKNFITQEGKINLDSLSYLSGRLTMMIRYLYFREIGLEDCYKDKNSYLF